VAEFFDYTTPLSALPDLSGRSADVTRTDAAVAYASTGSAWAGLDARFADTFAARHTGYLRVPAAGTYTLYVSSDDGSRVWLDGAPLIDNGGLHPMRERSATVALAAGDHPPRVEFFENNGTAGLNLSWSGPGIAKQAVPPAALAHDVGDAGFEQVQVGSGHFQYRPSGSPWAFSGGAGIAGNNSGFTSGNPPAPQGVQVAFLQATGSFSQAVAGWAAGTYKLTFRSAQRANHQASRQDFSVQVDGVVVGTFTPSGTSYQSYTTAAFSVAAGAHTITFRGRDSAGGDNTAFVDAVSIHFA
jgi:PA14 domain